MTHYTELEDLESDLVEMARGMTVPTIPNPAPAVLARVDAAERKRPALWPVRRRLVLIITLALSLTAGVAAAYALLYPIPEGFDISITAPGAAGGADVFIITSDDLEQLTNGPGFNGGATWSPDCSRIAFHSNRDGNPTPDFDIYMMNPDGTGVVKVVDTPGVDMLASWSPDGTRLVFSHDDVHWEPGPGPRGGRWRANSETALYLVNADGSGLTRLANAPAGGVADWSPDGRRILFSWDGGQEGTSEVYVINVDGTDLRNLTSDGAIAQHATWSPDGTRIAFASNREQVEEFGPANRWYWPEGGLDIHVMNADGTDVTRLTDHPENDMLPRWSPDGQRISFTSARISGLGGAFDRGPNRWDVYVMKADSSELTHVIQGTGHGWSSCKTQR